MTTLVVSAWLPEQRMLRERLGPAAGCEFLLTGVGPLRAAAAVAARLESSPGARTLGAPGMQDGPLEREARARPAVRRLIFVGTAGAYVPSRHPLCSAWEVIRVRLSDGGACRGDSYFPGAAESLTAEEWTSCAAVGPRVQGPLCVTPPSITRTVALAAELARLGDLENLELAGVAAACQSAPLPVPWVAFLGVSNEVGPSAHEEWKRWHEEASLQAQELARGNLGG